MIFCPFCEGYGIIYEAKVVNHDINVYICDECDTMWQTQDIQEENCINFKAFMNKFGYRGLWSELTNIKRSSLE